MCRVCLCVIFRTTIRTVIDNLIKFEAGKQKLRMLILLSILSLLSLIILYILQPYISSLRASRVKYTVNILKSSPRQSPRLSTPSKSSSSENSSPSHKYLTIIIPAYNEEERLPSTLSSITTYLSKITSLSNATIKIIIVDDGSKDSTGEVCRKWASSLPSASSISSVTLCTHVINSGKGASIKSGEAERGAKRRLERSESKNKMPHIQTASHLLLVVLLLA